MPRPRKCCRVAFLPDVTYFKPAGIPLRTLEEVQLSVEEAEAIRLKDLGVLDQEQGAERMNISRPTFQRVLTSARQKVAEFRIKRALSSNYRGLSFFLPPANRPKIKLNRSKIADNYEL